MKHYAIILGLMLTTACSTAQDSTLLGVGVGGVVGAGVGTLAGNSQGHPGPGAAIGAAVGAALGGLAGWLDFQQRGKEKNQSRSTTPSNGDVPTLSKPEVKRVWVPSKVEDNKFIEAHWIYMIDKQSAWRLEEKDRSQKNGK